MKLYIATSSLNIDNILSTESIAPLSFYKARNYGYNSFFEINLIPFKNILVLFSKIPYFEIQDREHDSRPVVIEIDINEQVNPLTFVSENNGVTIYTTDTIVRLSPFNTRILFYKPQDLNHSRLSCSDSLTNKLGDRFRFDLCKTEFDLSRLSTLNFHFDDICNDYENKTLQDNRLNTIKGFIFGYYLGVSKSVSANSAMLLKIQKRIYDIVATIKNNGGYGNMFYEELEQLDKKYRANDPNTIKCKEMWNKVLEELTIPTIAIDKFLEAYDEKNVVKSTFMKKNGLYSSISLHQYGFHNIESYRDNLKNYTTRIISEDQKKQLALFDVSNTFDLDPTYETCMLYGEDNDSTIFNKFIDAILWHGTVPTPDTLRTDRFNIATQITISAKSIWESQNWVWLDSPAQTFMNELRQNIKSFTPLDINKQENIILKSVAAFILKGEDYDSLVQFCEDNSFSDYRYSLALWGATIGYVKMSKPIIHTLTRDSSFGNIYKETLTLLYNISYEGDLPFVQEPVTIVKKIPDSRPFVSGQLRSEVQEVFNTLTLNQKRANEAKIEQALELEAAQGNFEAYLYILNNLINSRTNVYRELKRVLSSPESQGKELAVVVKKVLNGFTKKSDADNCQKALDALDLENKIGDPESFCYMLDDLNISKDVRKKFFNHFNIQQEEHNVLKKVGNFIGDLFYGQKDNSQVETKIVEKRKIAFAIHNINAIADIVRLINPGLSDFAYKQIINDLNWVFDPKYSAGKSEIELLEAFRENLISGQREPVSKNGKDMKWKNNAYRPIDIDKTINELKQSYINDR